MSPTPHPLLLRGCTPVPLAHYLKALGVLRLVAEQADAEATGHWTDDGFVLESRLDRAALTGFFLHDYRPTPIITPWNGRGGFLEGEENSETSDRKGKVLVDLFVNNQAERFSEIKLALLAISSNQTMKSLNQKRAEWKKTKAELKKTKTDQLADLVKKLDFEQKLLKSQLLIDIRNKLDPASLEWFDACQIVREQLLHSPLLGRGGVDGSMDFGINFLERIVLLFDIQSGKPKNTTADALDSALFSKIFPNPKTGIPGPFAPGLAGGPNATNGFKGDASQNLWDFILTIEGTLVLSAAASRRLNTTDYADISFPFTVKSRLAGFPGTSIKDDLESWKELWLPLWSRAATFPEISTLFHEGRLTIKRRTASDGLDAARAIRQLGFDRGIDRFLRFGLLQGQRSGNNTLAIPAGSFRAPTKGSNDLIADIDRFLNRLRNYVRSDAASTAVRSAARRLDDALFALATTAQTASVVQRALIALGEAQRVLGASEKARGSVPPVPKLTADWMRAANDGSIEFRIARALLSSELLTYRWLHAPSAPGEDTPLRPCWPWAIQLASVDAGRLSWQPDSRDALAANQLDTLLTQAMHRRLLPPRPDDERHTQLSRPSASSGVSDVTLLAFLHDETDDTRILALLRGLALIDPNARTKPDIDPPGRPAMLPSAFTALVLVFTPKHRLLELELLTNEQALWPAPREAAARLAAGDVAGAVGLAWRRLRSARLPIPSHPHAPPQLPGLDGPRLLAALTVPLHDAALKNLARRLLRQPAPSAS